MNLLLWEELQAKTGHTERLKVSGRSKYFTKPVVPEKTLWEMGD